MSIVYIYTRKIRSILQKPKISPQPDPSSGRKATLDLASLYAFCWQSLERAERSMDSERLLCVAQMLCRWIETARVVEGSGELPAFRFFC
jgi:flagellin-specific chaperone FliS